MDAEPPFLLAIDQGTTSTRAILFDAGLRPLSAHAIELKQIYPANGWVEHDPEEIWDAVVACCRVAAKGVSPHEIAAIGLANQRCPRCRATLRMMRNFSSCSARVIVRFWSICEYW